MAFIYLIWNDINPKLYIGKTENSIEHRWAEHCRDALKKRNDNRPLYRAMRKYGKEHFHIVFLEETDKPDERETFWIAALDAYTDGYNATRGGDGKRSVDYEKVVDAYRTLGSQKMVAEMLGICPDTVRCALASCGVETQSSADVNIARFGKAVDMLSRNGDLICSFESIYDAASRIAEEKGATTPEIYRAHISAVCKGRRKSAYGYQWRFQSENSLRDIRPEARPVEMYSMNNEFLMSFESMCKAVAYIADAAGLTNLAGARAHLTDVCRGIGKSAYGYIWKFKEAGDNLAS